VHGLLRDAEHILETGVAVTSGAAQDCMICISNVGDVHIFAGCGGWSLSALAADTGAEAVYRVEHRAGTVQVEGWSRAGSCILRREAPVPAWLRRRSSTLHAAVDRLGAPAVPGSDLSPQVKNS